MGNRQRGRPKKQWIDVIKENLEKLDDNKLGGKNAQLKRVKGGGDKNSWRVVMAERRRRDDSFIMVLDYLGLKILFIKSLSCLVNKTIFA